MGLQATMGLLGISTASVKMIGPGGVERYLSITSIAPDDAVYKVIYLTMGPQDIVYEFFERGHLDPVKHLQDHRTNNQLAK